MKSFSIKTYFKYVLLCVFISTGCLAILGSGGGGSDSSSGTDSNPDNNTNSSNAKWTYMVYIAADNDLSPAAIGDINEMEVAGSTSDVNIVVQVEYSSRFSPNMPKNTLRGKIIKDNNTSTITSSLTDIGNKDMGAKATLTEFITWAKSNYPAQHYALVLWDHGAGWKITRRTGGIIRGALSDDTSDSFMSLPDIASAISSSQVHFDIVNFDACLMAMYEVAYELSGMTDYLVFSEEVEAGEGDPYDTILQDLVSDPNKSAQSLATTITTRYKSFYQNQKRSTATKSAVDMASIATLHTQINGLVSLLDSNISVERPYIQSARDQSVSYNYPENHDLGDFLTFLQNGTTNAEIKSKITEIKTTLSTMTTSNQVYSPQSSDTLYRSNGLAIYIPKRDQASNQDLTAYNQLAINTARATDSWGTLVNTLVNGDASQGQSARDTTEGNFVIGLEWDTDADLDLIIWEPDGNFAAPFIGATSPNGFLSEDSAFSGESVEYYAAADMVEKGDYDVLVQYYDDGWYTTGSTTASIYLLDPKNGINDYTLQAQRLMDLSFPAPADWADYETTIYNVINGIYSDWWVPQTITRHLGTRNVEVQRESKISNIRIHFFQVMSHKKSKHLPRLDKDNLQYLKNYIQSYRNQANDPNDQADDQGVEK